MTNWPGDSRREQTTFGGLRRGELMARVRSFGNSTTEERLASLLRVSKLTGWRRRQKIVGKPDFVWRKIKVAVFVDGCFWHGHDCGKNISPKTNEAAWSAKIQRNKVRDREIRKYLTQLDWKVLRVWECELKKRPAHSLSRIRRAIASKTLAP
jgi:DNA mismatch endonuclease (patch repair protein)